MNELEKIQKQARARFARLERKRKDPRYTQVIGRLALEGLIVGKNVRPTRAHPTVDDALWVGEVEPRVLELLPAIVARRPKMFAQAKELPEDLEAVVKELKRGRPETPFRNVPPKQYAQWMARVGRTEAMPARPKLFRLREADLKKIEQLKARWGVSETEVIRRALANVASKD